MFRPKREFFSHPPGRPRSWLAFALVLFLTGGLASHAAELHLSNGDRVTGEVVRRDDGKIYFRSPVFGEIAVAETDAVVIDTPETPVESLTGLPPNEKPPPVHRQPARKAPAIAATPDVPGPVTQPADWKGKVEFGFSNQSGRADTLNLSVRTEFELKKGFDNYKASARYLYGKTNKIVSSDRQDASFRWRHDISERVFTQSLTSYTSDQVTRIYTNLEQNGSVGYQVLQTKNQKASIGSGLTLQYRRAEGLEPGVNFLGEVFQDYTYKINGRLTVSQAINALYSPNGQVRLLASGTNASKLSTDADNYKVRFYSTLQGKMSERISLNLRYEYEYDNAILQQNGRTDQRVTSSVGYAF
jgi:putative salt-induced outer membrane protein YdiY